MGSSSTYLVNIVLKSNFFTARNTNFCDISSGIFNFSPKCRVKVTGKKKNVVINGILEAYFKAYPHKRPALQPIDNTKREMKTATNTENEVCLKKMILLEMKRFFFQEHLNEIYDDSDEEEDDDDDEIEDDEDDDGDHDDEEEEDEEEEEVIKNSFMSILVHAFL
jgi:hypothetical protein